MKICSDTFRYPYEAHTFFSSLQATLRITTSARNVSIIFLTRKHPAFLQSADYSNIFLSSHIHARSEFKFD